MKIDSMLNQQGAWLRNEGPENQIVISSRIRLARNISGFPFMTKASNKDRQEIQTTVREMVEKNFPSDSFHFLDLEKIEELDRHYLLERQLISKETADAQGPRSVVIDKNEDYSVMINEEDHLRLQAMTSGLNLKKAWDCINAVDDRLENGLVYAFDSKLGYLTSCPTNLGTGIRVSVMLHLPGLLETKQIEKMFRSLQKINLAIRGMYGEGTEAWSDFFQISNQITLGHSEENLIEKVAEVVPQLIRFEQEARDYLLRENRDSMLDRCGRAVGLLESARKISMPEAMGHLSSIRLGVNLGLLDKPAMTQVNSLLLHLQPAHLQKLAGKLMSPEEMNIYRASYLKEHLMKDIG